MSNVLVNAGEAIKGFIHQHNMFCAARNLPHRFLVDKQGRAIFRAALMESVDSRCYWARPRRELDAVINGLFPELEMLDNENRENRLRDDYISLVLDSLYILVESVSDMFIPIKTWALIEVVQMDYHFGIIVGEDYRIADYHRRNGNHGRHHE